MEAIARVVAKLYTVKSSGGLMEYLEGEGKDGRKEYYLGKDAKSKGKSWGKGAKKLADDFGIDLADGFTREQIENLFEGLSPDGQEQLVQKMSGKHNPGYDITFAPPKDFSIELIYADPETRAAMERAHIESLQLALDMLEANTRPCEPSVGGGSKQRRREKGKLAAFLFTHYTSRPTKETIAAGRPPDIGFHTHAFVMNMAWSEGKWRAVNERRLIQKMRWARYVYEGNLTERLSEMGYKVQFTDEDRHGNRTWNLMGGDKRIRDLFSSRHRGIKKQERAFEKEYGRPPTWAEMQGLVRDDREAKDHECEEPSFDRYAEVVAEAGIDFDGHIRDSGNPMQRGPLEDRKEKARQIILGDQGLLKNGSSFQRYNLEATVLASSMGYLSPDEADEWLEEIRAGDDLILVEAHGTDSDYDRMTTSVNVERERYAVQGAIELSKDQAQAPLVDAVWDAIKRYELLSGVSLDDEQRAAVWALCDSTRWAHLTGPAGCGKTTVGRPVVSAWKTANLLGRRYAPKAYGVAVAASTAQRLADGFKCDAAYTVEAMAFAAEKIPEGSLVILDEAVMADTRRMAEFVRVAKQRKLVVRCMGDFYQLEGIGAAGTFRQINDAIGCSTLTKVYRQENWRDKAALHALRTGKADQSLRMLKKMGRYHQSESFEAAMGEALQHYVGVRKRTKATEVIINTDAPNQQIDAVNRLVQDKRRGAGELRGEPVSVTSELDKRTEDFYIGDVVAFTSSYEDAEHRVKVPNGTRGEVIRTAPWGAVVRTTSGQSIHVYLERERESQPIRLGYAGHATRVQGAQAKLCLVLPWLAKSDRGSAYSMASRGVEEVHVFNGYEEEKLAHNWAKFNPKETADRELFDAWEAEMEPEVPFEGVDEEDLRRHQWTQQRTRGRLGGDHGLVRSM